MGQNLTVKENQKPIYSIHIEPDYNSLSNMLSGQGLFNSKVCIITDTNVSPYYLEEVFKITKEYAAVVETFIIQPGEENKNLHTVNSVYEFLIRSNFQRNDLLIALGGGVIGDMTGFVAATYLRGVRFIQMPTTLLSMVDSSIGGKTGVDFMAYKNMVGAFYQPQGVYINLSALDTLPDQQFFSGFAEIIKCGLLGDKKFYYWLQKNQTLLLEKNREALAYMVYTSCHNKQIVVEQDPKEKGVRALLNLGHTIGHAIEKLKEFSLFHGYCVSLGTVAAAALSWKKGFLKEEEVEEICLLLESFHLPTYVSGLSWEEILSTTKSDKKMDAGKIKFILLKEIGHAIIDTTVTDDDLKWAISYILKEGNTL